jgi:ABC-2 type transport system permease protein
MAALFGAMLTAISTVYDREFGMLRLMLASPAGAGAVLAGRAIAATVVGAFQGAVILLCAPLIAPIDLMQAVAAIAALLLTSAMCSMLGLLVAAPIRSVENFAGVINVVLFPLLFVSGALYPTDGLPTVIRTAARLNPVSYGVDLMRDALGQPAEFTLMRSVLVLCVATLIAFVLAVYLFDPEQRSTPALRRGAVTPAKA